MTATINVPQSKRGFHPVNYEDFKKIKLLHKHYWIAKRAEGAHNRYWRKDPQNRVIRKQNRILLTKPIPMGVPFFPSVYEKILKRAIVPLYHQARHPQPTPEAVKPLTISMSQVEEWLTQIEKAYAERK